MKYTIAYRLCKSSIYEVSKCPDIAVISATADLATFTGKSTNRIGVAFSLTLNESLPYVGIQYAISLSIFFIYKWVSFSQGCFCDYIRCKYFSAYSITDVMRKELYKSIQRMFFFNRHKYDNNGNKKKNSRLVDV